MRTRLLQTLQTSAAELRAKIASLDKKIDTQAIAPVQLQDRFAKLEGRLSDLASRLAAVENRTAAVLEDPQQANVDGLDAALASTQARVADPSGALRITTGEFGGRRSYSRYSCWGAGLSASGAMSFFGAPGCSGLAGRKMAAARPRRASAARTTIAIT